LGRLFINSLRAWETMTDTQEKVIKEEIAAADQELNAAEQAFKAGDLDSAKKHEALAFEMKESAVEHEEAEVKEMQATSTA